MKLFRVEAFSIFLFVLLVSICHFTVGVREHEQHVFHVIFRTLYLIPIISAAIWFRLPGAILTSLGISSIYAIHILTTWEGRGMENTNQWAMVGVYLILGTVSGFLSSLENRQRQARLQSERNKQREMTLISLESLSIALKMRDQFTQKHSENVASLAVAIGEELNMHPQRIESLRLAARVHDIGKIGIKDDILFKNNKLTLSEMESVKKHPLVAANILRPIPGADFIADIVLAHHEHPDGTGYPQGLKSEEIPFESLVLSGADVFSALTEDRPYHMGLESDQALVVIEEFRGNKLDSKVIDALKRLLERANQNHSPASWIKHSENPPQKENQKSQNESESK